MERRKGRLAVIGGGISGLGIAREAASAGFQVTVFERDRCASHTSANSLRIIHGGFRYLQSADLPRVYRSLRAQASLLARYPQEIAPLRCVMPLRASGFKSARPAQLAHHVYSLFSRLSSGRPARGGAIDRETLARQVPVLAEVAPFGALEWWDAVILDPERFTLRLLGEARQAGVLIQEHSPVLSVARSADRFTLRVMRGESEELVEAERVVNAAGPWVNSLPSKNFVQLPDLALVRWCKAFNVVVRRQLDPDTALALHSSEGRLFFAVPRGQGTAIGTAYHPIEGQLGLEEDAPIVSEEEVEEFLAQFSTCLPQARLAMEDVVEVERGVLPMRRVERGAPVLYGSERIAAAGGYLEVLSTKYTTFESQARRAVRLLDSQR